MKKALSWILPLCILLMVASCSEKNVDLATSEGESIADFFGETIDDAISENSEDSILPEDSVASSQTPGSTAVSNGTTASNASKAQPGNGTNANSSSGSVNTPSFKTLNWDEVWHVDAYIDGWVYFYEVDPVSNIQYVSRRRIDGTGKLRIQTINSGYKINGDWLYYSDDTQRSLNRVRLDGTSRQTLVSVAETGYVPYAPECIFVGDRIYFKMSGGVYSMRTDGTDKRKISDVEGNFLVNGDWLFVCDISTFRRVRLDGTEEITLVNGDNIFPHFVNSGYIYFNMYANGRSNLYRMKIDGFDQKLLISGHTLVFGADDGFIYWEDLGKAICRIRMDGSDKTVLYEKPFHVDFREFRLTNGYIFYREERYDTIIARMSPDGSKYEELFKTDGKTFAADFFYVQDQLYIVTRNA